MDILTKFGATPMDLIAVIWFLGLWVGYTYYADINIGETKNLVKVIHRYRLQWIKAMIKREDRLVDIRVIANLLSTTTFFASTSILIIAGVTAALGYGEKALPIISALPFAEPTDLHMWVLKTLFIMLIFIHSFFKFTWVVRQFNFVAVLILSAPVYVEGQETLDEVKKDTHYVIRIANMLTNAARHFNMGMRSYYFGFVAISWYVSPILFMFFTVLVIGVLYRREFISRTLVQLI